MLNSLVSAQFITTKAFEEDKHPQIQDLRFSLKPICESIESKYSQLMESKALSNYTLNNKILFFIFFAHPNKSFTINGPSDILLPSKYVDWTSPTTFPTTVFNLMASNLEINFIHTTNEADWPVVTKSS